MPFDFHLARIIGCTVAELGDRITMIEYMQWSRFLAVENQSKELADRAAAAKWGG